MTVWLVIAIVVAAIVVFALVRKPLFTAIMRRWLARQSRLAARDRARAEELGYPVPPPPLHERNGLE